MESPRDWAFTQEVSFFSVSSSICENGKPERLGIYTREELSAVKVSIVKMESPRDWAFTPASTRTVASAYFVKMESPRDWAFTRKIKTVTGVPINS